MAFFVSILDDFIVVERLLSTASHNGFSASIAAIVLKTCPNKWTYAKNTLISDTFPIDPG